MDDNRHIKNRSKPPDKPFFGVDIRHDESPVTGEVARYFARFDVQSDYLKNLLCKAVGKILRSGMRSDVCFGSVVEGGTIAGGIAEVTGDRCIRINSLQLMQYEEAVAMALVAHELAHDHLGHFKTWKNNLELEQSADNLAEQWGFNVNQFRKTLGPPCLNSRLQRIAMIP